LQVIVALSMTKAEYMAIVETSKKALWLRGLVETFNIIQHSVRIHCDNQSVIHLAKDYRYRRYHKIRQWVMDDKVINLVKVSTKMNPADMMTKTILV